MKKNILNIFAALFWGCVISSASAAPQAGTPIFSDSFDSVGTFAENWIFSGKTKSENGTVTVDGTFRLRRPLPKEFFLECNITLKHDMNRPRGFAGMTVAGYHFKVQPDGKSFLVWKTGSDQRAKGVYKKIDDFIPGQPVHCAIARTITGTRVTYTYFINGKFIGSFEDVLPDDTEKGTFAALEFGKWRVDSLKVNDFKLSMVKRSEEESPNLTVNSSFEHLQDGFPLYIAINTPKNFSLPDFAMERYLETFGIDDNVKRSGKYSFRMKLDPLNSGSHTVFFHSTGTAKGQSGVFSAYLKGNDEGLKVCLNYGGTSKIVSVGKEWKRYEVVCPALPAPSTYSPARISFRIGDGNPMGAAIWMDDIQAEYLPSPVTQEFLAQAEKTDKIFATPYKPSELDKEKFQPDAKPSRSPSIQIPMLPVGVRPSVDLDSWVHHASKKDDFRYKNALPKRKTEGYFACDEDNLYVGLRVFGDDFAAHKKDIRDSLTVCHHGMELLIDPSASGKKWIHLGANAAGTMLDLGFSEDKDWLGNWKCTSVNNIKKGCVDSFLVIPFSDLAGSDISDRWLLNLGANDSIHKQYSCIGYSPNGMYRAVDYWPEAVIPVSIALSYKAGIKQLYTSANTMGTESVIADFENCTGKNKKVTISIYTANGAHKLLAEKELQVKNGNTLFDLNTAVSEKKVNVVVREEGKIIFNRNLPIENRKSLVLLGRLNFYMNEPEAFFQVRSSLPNMNQLRAELTCNGKKAESKVSPVFRTKLPIADFAPGTYDVTLRIYNGKNIVAEAKDKLLKREYWEGAVQINRFSRSVMQNGKAIMPFSLFFVSWYPGKIEEYTAQVVWQHKEKFRTLHILFDARCPEKNAAVLNEARKRGMPLIYWHHLQLLTQDSDRTKVDDRKLAELAKEFSKKHTNILSQLVLDEPELIMKSDDALAILRKTRPLFPYHPVQMNNTIIGIPNNYANMETDILMLDDYLTNGEIRDVYSVIRFSDIMWKIGEAEGKPCWYFLVGGNFPLHYREPSYAEQIAQCYGHIASGGTGISLFYGNIQTPGNWKAVKQLNDEFTILNDIITSDELVQNASISGNPDLLRMRTKKYRGYLYLIAANIGNNSYENVMITLPEEYRYADHVEVMFENRNISLKDGKFTDNFPALSRHVYKVKLLD